MPTQRRYTLDTVEDKVKVLYYGEPGSGKTTASAALARLGRTVAINAEGGFKKKPLVDLGVPVQDIEIFPTITFDTLDRLFWDLKEELDSEKAPVGLIWDSLSESHKKLLGLTRERAVEKTRNKGKEREQFDTYVEDYGTNTEEMRHLARQFRDLNLHEAWTALPRRDQDDDGAVFYGPDLTPRLAGDIMGFVDIMCHCEEVKIYGLDEPQYWGTFRAGGKFRTKDRFHALPPRLINPSMDRIVAYVNGDITVEEDEQQKEALSVQRRGEKAEEKAGPPKAAPKLAGARG